MPDGAEGNGHTTYQVELLLELLVGIVDTKLLKAVDVKCLKSENKATNERPSELSDCFSGNFWRNKRKK